jgi:hypothetical protein
MKEEFKQRVMAEYPVWHEQPLNLTISEIENPRSVLSLFFRRYNLPNIRACLKEFLYDALCADGVDAQSHVITHQDIERLVEAAWLIYQQKATDYIHTKRASVEENPKSKIEITEANEMHSCYQTIHDFFDSITLPSARNYLRSSIKAAEVTGIWDKKAPTELLSFFESLDTLINAVYSIVKEDHKMNLAILDLEIDMPDLNKTHLFCGTYDQLGAWDYFPRYLSKKEYNDPYKALGKFTSWTSKKEWKEHLRYLLNFALSQNSLSEFGVDLQMVRITELLFKMLEATHLIDVRLTLQKTNSSAENE